MKFQLIFVFLALAVSYGYSQGLQVYCGRKLADTLANLCDYTTEEKKSVGYNEVDYEGIWPWIGPNKALAMAKPRAKRQGIVQECCEKPCSINELLSYC